MRLGNIAPTVTKTDSLPFFQQILNALPQIGTAYLSIEQQRQLNKINLQRAQLGQPLLDPAEFQPGVTVGVNKSTQNTVLLLAAGIGAALLISGSRRRR